VAALAAPDNCAPETEKLRAPGEADRAFPVFRVGFCGLRGKEIRWGGRYEGTRRQRSAFSGQRSENRGADICESIAAQRIGRLAQDDRVFAFGER
jgi:hypothetical protein